MTMPVSIQIPTPPTPPAASPLAAHVREYLADLPSHIVVRDAVESGWHAGRADVAEGLRALVAEARTEVAKHMPFPILKRLEAIVTELEAGLGE